MPNPLDYLIQNPDAMRYALLQDASYKGGGAVRMAEGGSVFNPQGTDYDYQTARAYGMGQGDGNWGSVAPTSEDERKLHGLPEDSYLMLKGAQHPTWGKSVEAETARGSKIVKYGDRYYSVPSKAEGGEVSQSELDRMRFELERRSPVIEATPQSATQRAIGTVGGYLDKAGRFISGALEPIAKANPVRTALVDMFLADPLKNAGTALQDYTKTGREITEDQPYVRSPLTGSGQTLRLDPRMLDVLGVAQPVVSGAAKLAGAGAKVAAPFARSTAEMANELYASGQMPGMVNPAMNVVKPYYHGSDIKGLKVLDPEASNGRRSNGSSVWVNPVDLQAASYAKKKSGSLYEVPLDTEGFAIVDADFTGNKSISPGAVIQHSNGEVTPVSALGDKVTTDDIAAHSRAKGDPGVRILNVGDMGSGRLHTDATHGESVAVHSPVEVKSERNVKDLISENSEQSVNSKELTQNTSLTPENLDALREYAAGLSNSKIGGYSQIQNILRKGSPTYKDVDPVLSSKIVEDLVDAFANSKTELPQTVYRGTRVRKGSEREELLKLQPGSIYLDKGLTSTSKDKSVVARKFSNKLNRSDTLVNFVIDVPEGSSAIDLQQALGKEHGHEKEIALAPSTKFEVTKVSTGKGFSPGTGNPPEQGVRTIHMKVIKEKPGGYARGGSVKKPFTSPKHSSYNNTDYMRYELSRQG